MRQPGTDRPALSVVMPAYNEEGAIGQVVDEWISELSRLELDYELLVYDDGSRDRTPELLKDLAARHPRLDVRRHANRGHGPTILRGYREARGEWIFQVDADGEMPASSFLDLWSRRESHDVLLGYRSGRNSDGARKLITSVARNSIRGLFGARLRDVNTPYRLMRRDCLQPLAAELPDDTFAPNVLVSGMAARRGLRIDEQPVPFRDRVAGSPSLVRWSLWKGALRAFRQTIQGATREVWRR